MLKIHKGSLLTLQALLPQYNDNIVNAIRCQNQKQKSLILILKKIIPAMKSACIATYFCTFLTQTVKLYNSARNILSNICSPSPSAKKTEKSFNSVTLDSDLEASTCC